MVAILAAAAAAAVSLGAAGVPSTPARACSAYESRALIGGRAVCLGEGAACASRYEQRYRRYGFRCRGGLLAYDWARLYRPLQVPALAAGAQCPAALPNGTLGQRGSSDGTASPAFGPGPAYPTLDAPSGSAVLTLVWPPDSEQQTYAGWAGTKALWAVPRYAGAVLIRGRQLDGPNPLGFDLGPGWTRRVLPEIRLVGPQDGLHPAATFVRSAGCYAYQVDTLRSSYTIVFEARVGYR